MSEWKKVVQSKLRVQDAALEPYKVPADQLPPLEEDVGNTLVDFFVSGKLVSPLYQEITEISDASVLLARIKDRKYSSVDVIKAYIHRATIAQQLTTCLTEINFDRALAQAKALDEELAAGKPARPLHGLPISLKDQFDIEGLDSTLGYAGRSNKPRPKNSALVTIVEKLGAICFVKTNLPLSIMTSESDNNLWGVTKNPYNRALTSGGSSGGESALLIARGSIVGWGTDLTGSVRIPQAMCGGYSLRPTSSRFPYRDVSVTSEGAEHNPSVIGPMTRDYNSLLLISKAVLEEKPWYYDSQAVPIPWAQEFYDTLRTGKLRIGVHFDNGIIRPHPPVERVLSEVVEKLKAAGHDVFRFDTGVDEIAYDLMNQYYYVDGADELKRDLEVLGEPATAQVLEMIEEVESKRVVDYWKMNIQKRDIQNKVFDLWNQTYQKTSDGRLMDLMLSPTLATSAVPHGQTIDVTFTELYSALNYPSVNFPAGRVDKTIDVADTNYQPRNTRDAAVWSRYDAESMHGLPIGLQLAARPFEEEKILGGLGNVLESLKIDLGTEFSAGARGK